MTRKKKVTDDDIVDDGFSAFERMLEDPDSYDPEEEEHVKRR